MSNQSSILSSFAQSVASGNLPQKAVQWLLCRDYGTHLTQLREWLESAQECGGRIRALTGDLTTISGAAFWSGNPDGPWGSLQALAEYALANREELPRWSHFFRLQAQSRESGLAKLTALAEARSLEPHEIGPAFRFVFHNTLARSVFTDNVELSQVTGVTQELIRPPSPGNPRKPRLEDSPHMVYRLVQEQGERG
jgi:hypothetical protein